MIVFQREQAQDCFQEAIPLIVEHGRELKYFDELKIEPEFARYEQLESLGLLRTYTARLDESLLGYAVFFFSPHLHFKRIIFANCDILYIHKNHRGFGLRFIKWCVDQLKIDGANVVYFYVNRQFDYSPILKRIGFEHTDELYTKRIR